MKKLKIPEKIKPMITQLKEITKNIKSFPMEKLEKRDELLNKLPNAVLACIANEKIKFFDTGAMAVLVKRGVMTKEDQVNFTCDKLAHLRRKI